MDFLASSQLIGYIDSTDSYEFGQNVPWLSMRKSMRGFFHIQNASPFTRSHVTKIGEYSIRQLQNRFSQQATGISKKPHTLLQSLTY